MIKNFLALVALFIAFSFSVLGQSAKSAPTQKTDPLERRLRAHVDYLSSDKLEGRRTGEKGATSGAGYVAGLFASFGLKGGVVRATNGAKPRQSASFLQSFPFVQGVEITSETKLVINSPKAELTVNLNSNWMPFGSSINADLGKTPIVFAGYGIVSSEAKYDDYTGLDAKGKIVLVFDGTPENENPRSAFARFDVRAKANIAKEKGAVAVIFISREEKLENDRNAQLKYDQTLGETALPCAFVARSIGALLLGENTEKGLKDAEDWIKLRKDAGEGIQLNLSNRPNNFASLKINLVKRSTEAYNVIGVLQGTDLKDEAIVIGAHYDHLGHGGQGSLAANSTEIHHGADDNASGVAGLIELARNFSQSKQKPRRTIIFMAFGGEEEGLLGSKFYVNNPTFPLDKTVAMFNMDMIGRLRENKLTVGGIGTASEWKGLVESENQQIGTLDNLKSSANIPDVKSGMETPEGKPVAFSLKTSDGKSVASASAITTNFILQLSEDGFGPSDHSSFYGKQIPVLFFFTGTHEDYHKPTDTVDKINFEGLKQVESFVAELVKAVDTETKRPTHTVAKSSGTGEGRRGFNIFLGTIPNYAGSSDGLLLDGVRENSPAARATLKAGDKIVKLAGVDVKNISDYTFALGEMKADVEYEIEIIRQGERLKLKITPVVRKQ